MSNQRRLIFLFFDGIGMGVDDPSTNPFAKENPSFLSYLLDGRQLLEGTPGFSTDELLFRPLDPNMGIDGTPQSATGQAAIITGKNIPRLNGGHYGPKPNEFIRDVVSKESLFIRLGSAGKSYTMVNAYPDGFLEQIESGRRLPGTFALSYMNAGNNLKTKQDLEFGTAISADYTGVGWHEHLGITTIPLITPQDAAQRLVDISSDNAFTFFEIWLTDLFGHRQEFENALKFLEETDLFIRSLYDSIDLETTAVLITSDHGNMENLSTRKHTTNHVPGIVIGNRLNQTFFENMVTLADITPAIQNYLEI